MTRKPAFWISFSILSILCTVFVFWFFPRAFPIISLDISMTRGAALDSAALLADAGGWGPRDAARAVASFQLDGEVQTFVELEGGGAEAFNAMLADPVYTPYTWRVRRFREGEVNEVNVRFRPDGRPFGFVEKIAEDAERPNLSADAALELGRLTAAADWQIDLTDYRQVESGQEQRPNGRVDHTFVYERIDDSLGEGSYRVRISVSGDRVSEIMPLVRVPEAFKRRYEEMRSANTAIGAGGSVGAIFIYLLAGGGIGCFYLLRRHALFWRPAVLVAGVIAAAVLLAQINEWPLRWLQYDTALPSGRFMIQTLLPMIILALVLGAVMAVSFMVAEGLSRLAFPEHPQFWRIWRRDAAPTPAIAGRTAAGYLAMPLMLTYVMLFYFIAGRLWGWWNPSEALVNPDSLAHYAPWFTPFAMALQAGVWEECLFRAVPLAGAALLGQYFGRRNLFIVIMLVLQAIIFGAAHATYPAQPAYARLVELIIPSLLFGIFYLRYGLLPGIVLHFTFDIVLMALPVFASSGAGVWLDRTLVVILTLLPALVVATWRIKSGRWLELPGDCRNAAWQAPVKATVLPEPPAPAPAVHYTNTWPRLLIPVLGLVCVVSLPAAIWLHAGSRPHVPILEVTKTDAERIARETLTGRGVELPDGTRALVGVLGAGSMQDRFIWQTAGREMYETLIGDWLHPPRYIVRFARFEGDVAERAEEWLVTVTTTGVARTVRHTVAEAAAGADLEEAQARALALTGLERELGVAPSAVREVSVEPEKQPARTDWRFIFADAKGEPLPEGERRMQVDIAGDEVIGAVKLIHIPEEWQREQRATDIAVNVMNVLQALVLGGLLIAGVVAAIIAWSKRRFAVRYFLTTSLVALAVGLVLLGNNSWPAAAAQFSTAQPFMIQAAVTMIMLAILIIAAAVGAGLIMGMAAPWRRARVDVRSAQLAAAGIFMALTIQSLGVLIVIPFGTVMPDWPATMPAGSVIPVLAPVAAATVSFITYTLLALLTFGVADRYTAAWTRNKVIACVLLFLVGATLYGSTAGGTLAAWSVSALVSGCVSVFAYWLLIRHDLAVIPIITAASSLLNLLPAATEPYPGAWAGSILAILVIAGLGWWWFKTLRAYQD